jgi:hypothetical protein
MHINDTPQTPGVYLALFTDDTCMYAMEGKEGYVLRKLQCGLNSTEEWFKHWSIKINEDKLGPSTSLIDLDHMRFISH